MPSTGTTVLVLVVGAGTGTGAIDAHPKLEDTLQDAVDSALRDMSIGWLDVTAADGQVQNGTVEEARMLVRTDGTVSEIDLDELVARSPNGTRAQVTVADTLRDADGSMDEDILNEGNLVELRLVLEEGLEPREERTITVPHPSGTPLDLRIQAPNTFPNLIVDLDVQRNW
jgi:flavin-binding protein dodecin